MSKKQSGLRISAGWNYSMNVRNVRASLWIDPRTKIAILLLCVLSATMAPSMRYEMLLVLLIACLGIACRKVRYSIIGALVYVAVYFVTIAAWKTHGSVQVMLVAFLGLVHKVYPCGILSGIIISTTKAGEFLTAMNRSRVPRKIVIPVAVMLRYLPTVREDWHFIKDAMKMRDISPSLRSFLTNPGMTIECIYVPLMMAACKTADELTVSSVTRGIENPKPRTSIVQIGLGVWDIVVTVCFLSLFLAGQFCKGVF